MIHSQNDNGIVESTEHRVIGEVYDDSWDDTVRVQFRNKPDREMHIESLNQLADRKGWGQEVEGNSGNTNLVLYKIYKVRECKNCEGEPLYDTSEEEWYCPRCE